MVKPDETLGGQGDIVAVVDDELDELGAAGQTRRGRFFLEARVGEKLLSAGVEHVEIGANVVGEGELKSTRVSSADGDGGGGGRTLSKRRIMSCTEVLIRSAHVTYLNVRRG